MSRSLHEAVKVGKVEEVIIRLNIGEDIDQSYPPRHETPLHLAVECHNIKVVEILCKREAKVNLSNCDGETPLAVANRKHFGSIAELLAKYGGKSTSTIESPTMYNYMEDPMLSSLPPWDPGYSIQDPQLNNETLRTSCDLASPDWSNVFVGNITSKKIIYPIHDSDCVNNVDVSEPIAQSFKVINKKKDKFCLKLKKIRDNSVKLLDNQIIKMQGSCSNILARKQKPKNIKQEKFVKFWLSNSKGQTFKLYSFKEEN